MPKWLHDKLARDARKKGLTGDRFKAYVYGTLDKIADKSPFKKWRKKRRG